MLTFHIISLFPELIELYCQTSIIGRGARAGRIEVKTYNPRDFCQDKYRKVDDTPYGGGVGMVLKPEPFYAAFEAIEERPAGSPVIMTSPQGRTLDHSLCAELAEAPAITIFCGHYEGFDERIRELATMELSVGDYVLTGGELPALVVVDSVGRLVPGVVGKNASVLKESFTDGLLEGPQYTKPPVFRGMEVPPIVRSGNHKEIARWRRTQALARTLERRPDLIARLENEEKLDREDRRILDELRQSPPDLG